MGDRTQAFLFDTSDDRGKLVVGGTGSAGDRRASGGAAGPEHTLWVEEGNERRGDGVYLAERFPVPPAG